MNWKISYFTMQSSYEIVNQLDKECNFFFLKSLKIPKIPKKHYVTAIIIKVVWNFVISKKKGINYIVKILERVCSYRPSCNTVWRYLCCKIFQDQPGTKRLFDLHQYVHNNDILSVNHRLLPKFPADFHRLNSVIRSLNFFYRDSL